MRVLLAVDGSTCADTAVEAMSQLFQPARTEVRVVRVLEWPKDLPTSLAFSEGRGAAHAVLRAKDEEKRRARELLTAVVDRLTRQHFAATAHLVEGGARQAIVSMATDWPADIIVMGSHGRHGLERMFLGSVSEGVVRHAPCSVHIVRERVRHAADGADQAQSISMQAGNQS